MMIRRISAISGIARSRNININPDDWISYVSGYKNIYDAMPYLSDEDRDFILSGITKKEWEDAFVKQEE